MRMNMSFLEAAADKMMTDFKMVSGIKHNGVKGTIRELSVIETLLEKYLPKKYEIGTGIIVNVMGEQSKQQDIVIFDAFSCPLLYNEDNIKIFPIENVYCTIEVKSTLDKSELQKSVINIESVRALVQPELSSPNGFIFAFQSRTKIETVTDNLIEMNKSIDINKRASVVCIMDQGLIVHFNKHGLNKVETDPDENTLLGYIEGDHKRNLITFYLSLLECLNRKKIIPPNMKEYAMKQGYLTQESYVIPATQEYPEDAFFLTPDNKRIYIKQAFEETMNK